MKTNRFNFTRKSILAPALPKGKAVRYWDSTERGLGVLVQPGGHRAYFWYRKVQGRPKWRTIGSFDDLSIEQARDSARTFSENAAAWKLKEYEGLGPFATKGAPTLGELIAKYCVQHLKLEAKNPDRAIRTVEWQTGKYLSELRNRKAASLTKPEILDLRERLEKDHGSYVANRIAVQFLRAVFNWATANDLWDRPNPTRGIKLFHEDKRSRFIQRDELPIFFAELKKEKNDDLRDFVHLGIYTGARRGDILSMKWDDVYLDRRIETCEWRVPEPKNNTPYVVVLTVEAVAILLQRRKRQKTDSPWVFPSYSKSGHVIDLKKAWRRFLKRTGLTDLRIHDLRRTHGSWQASGGSSLPIIGKSLGHRSLVATEIYSRVDLEAVRGSVTDAVRAISQAAKKKPKLLTAGGAA